MEFFINLLLEVVYAMIAIFVGYMWKLIRDVIQNKLPNDTFKDVVEDIGDELDDDFGWGTIRNQLPVFSEASTDALLICDGFEWYNRSDN